MSASGAFAGGHCHSVLFTIPNFITAGSGRAMLNIIERLDRTRFQAAVCVLKKGGDLDAEVLRLGCQLMEAPFVIPARPYLSLPMRARRAAAPFRKHRFQLWHSFHYTSDYTEPLVARFAGAKAWVFTKKNMGWKDRAWRVRSLLASRIVALNTDMNTEFFGSRCYRSKSRLVPRGVVTERFQASATSHSLLRQQCGLRNDSIVVGCVGHLVPVKGHPTLLQALARVPGMVLFIAGRPMDEEYTAAMHKLVGESDLEDRVHFLGGVSDVPGLHAELDIFAFPSRMPGEGCPVALLEAMSCGKPCVATDIPGSRDLIEHGKSGLLVPPENPEALAAALRRLAESPSLRRELGAAARQRVLDRYTIEHEVAAHEALYAEILGLKDVEPHA